VDSSELLEVSTILLLKLIVLGLFPETHGLINGYIILLMMKRTTLITIRTMAPTQKNLLQTDSYLKRKRVAEEYRKLNSRMDKSLWKFPHGPKMLTYQRTGTGEMLTILTSSHGARISTSLSIVAHAGLKAQPLPLQIDSISYKEITTQPQLHSLPKL